MNRIYYDLCARDTHLTLGHVTRIMGIVNCTPDSFSGDGKLRSQGQNQHCRLPALCPQTHP